MRRRPATPASLGLRHPVLSRLFLCRQLHLSQHFPQVPESDIRYLSVVTERGHSPQELGAVTYVNSHVTNGGHGPRWGQALINPITARDCSILSELLQNFPEKELPRADLGKGVERPSSRPSAASLRLPRGLLSIALPKTDANVTPCNLQKPRQTTDVAEAANHCYIGWPPKITWPRWDLEKPRLRWPIAGATSQ